MITRYFIQLSYKGTNFHGWQYQPNALSVQETVESKLAIILQQKIPLTGAGRTDTGVHARFYVAHFEVDTDIETVILTRKLNMMLPSDIAVQTIFEVDNNLHARFDALRRTYEYYFHFAKDPFLQDISLYSSHKLDVETMNLAANELFHYTDFTSFSKLHTDVKTNNCQIYKAEWRKAGNNLIFTIEADRFLRNMVRAIVGTLVEIGKHKMTIAEFKNIIERKNRNGAGMSMPAHGLFLTKIDYQKEVNDKFML